MRSPRFLISTLFLAGALAACSDGPTAARAPAGPRRDGPTYGSGNKNGTGAPAVTDTTSSVSVGVMPTYGSGN